MVDSKLTKNEVPMTLDQAGEVHALARAGERENVTSHIIRLATRMAAIHICQKVKDLFPGTAAQGRHLPRRNLLDTRPFLLIFPAPAHTLGEELPKATFRTISLVELPKTGNLPLRNFACPIASIVV